MTGTLSAAGPRLGPYQQHLAGCWKNSSGHPSAGKSSLNDGENLRSSGRAQSGNLVLEQSAGESVSSPYEQRGSRPIRSGKHLIIPDECLAGKHLDPSPAPGNSDPKVETVRV